MKLYFAIIVATLLSLSPLSSQEARPSAVDETELLFNTADSEGEGTGPLTTDIATVGPSDYLKMLISLAFVVLLIYGALRILRRFSRRKQTENEMIKVLSTQYLKGDTALHLVEAGEQLFLVGTGTVTSLGEITNKEGIDAIRLAASQEAEAPSSPFSALVKGRLGQKEESGYKQQTLHETVVQMMKKRRNKIRDL